MSAKSTITLVIASMTLVIFAATSFAEEVSLDEASKKSATLGGQQVFSASKVPKSLAEAPAIISVYGQSYINDFGFVTLTDLLNTTPGFDGRKASWWEGPATRGLTTTSLLLVDGTPMVSNLSDIYAAGNGLDLSNYKRVEVLSGPGSVLWGVHSLLGVVNLLSLDGADIQGARGNIELGSFGRMRYGLKAGGRWNDLDVFVSASMTLLRDDIVTAKTTSISTIEYGKRYLGEPGSPTTNQTDYYWELLAKITYRQFTLFGRIPFSKNYFQLSEAGGNLAYGDNGFYQSDDWLFYLSYRDRFLNFKESTLSFLAKAYLYRNVATFDDRLWSSNSIYPNGYGFFIREGDAIKIGGVAELSWNYALFKRFIRNTLTVGGEAFRESVTHGEVRISDANGAYSSSRRFGDEASAFALSAFAVDEISFADRISLFGGARLNYSDSYRRELSLSGNVVGKIWGTTYAKLNITQGLRAPTMAHRFARAPFSALLGNWQDPKDPENPFRPATSTAIQIELNSRILSEFWLIQDMYLRGDIAFTTVKGSHVLENSTFDPSVLYYLQKVNRDVFSVEARLDMVTVGRHQLWTSYSYAKVRTLDGKTHLAQSGPQHALSFGLKLRFISQLHGIVRGNVVAEEIGSVIDFNTVDITGGKLAPQTIDPRFVLDLGLRLTNFFGKMQLSLMAYNVTNTKYSNYVFQNVATASESQRGQIIAYPREGFNMQLNAMVPIY